MAITVNLYYTGKNGSARAFAREMVSSGVAAEIRAEEGNLRYEYFFPMEDEETVLLIDSWRDQQALDVHHASPMMGKIMALRQKYDLEMRAERYVTDQEGFSSNDRRFMTRLGEQGRVPVFLYGNRPGTDAGFVQTRQI